MPEKATPEMIEKAKDMCRRSLWYLCTHHLGYTDWDIVHDDLERFMVRPSRKKLILIPRGHLKSAIVTKALTIQHLLRDPNSRVLIAHEVWDKAREILSEIKEYLTTKSQLPLLFGAFISERWNADQIVIRQRTKALSAPSIGTTGVESEMTSTHYDVIICDDLQGLQNSQTKEQRDKVKRFLNSLLDLLEPGGLLIVVGTRWHNDDIYAHILETQADYYDIMVRQVIEDGKLIFPKKFSLRFDKTWKTWVRSAEQVMDYIDHLKASKGADFYAQYMNNPVDDENQTFKKNYFQYWTKRPDGLYVGMAVDLAIGLKQESDYSTIVVGGMDKDYNIYILDYIRGHWTPYDIVDNMFQMHAKWNPAAYGMETNGFQRTLKYAMEEEMRKRRTYFPISEIKTSNQVSKEFRIKALEPYYRNNAESSRPSGKIYHAEWMRGKALEEELMSFPKGKHDDLADAEAMLLNLLLPGNAAAGEKMPDGCWEQAAQNARRLDRRMQSFIDHL